MTLKYGPPGEGNNQAKLTEHQIIQIRADALLGLKQEYLAAVHNVSNNRISQIVNRKAWGHIPWWRVWEEGRFC